MNGRKIGGGLTNQRQTGIGQGVSSHGDGKKQSNIEISGIIP